MAKRFDIAKASAGAKKETTADGPKRKVPKLSEMQLTPREKTTTQRPTTNAPVNVCVYKVTDSAGDLWANFKDVQTKLWQVQIDHDARPSVTVRMYDSFNEFLKEQSRSSPGSVESTKQLENDAGIRLVMTNQDDPDGLGCFKQYRVAWYIAGEIDQVNNFFSLLDNYLLHKAKQFARATPFEVNVYPYTDVDLESLPDQMSYKPIKVHPCGRDLPLKLFETHPVVGKKVLTLNFETESASELSLVITGNTWNFRDDLEKNGFQGTREKEGGQYIRYVRNVDITSTEGEQQFLALTVEGQKRICRNNCSLTC